MRRRLGVGRGVGVACNLIVGNVIQVSFGSGGIDLSVQPYEAKVEVGSTCTYNITLFSFEGNWFKSKILTGTCDPNWFEWLDSGQIDLKEGDTEQMSLNVTPSKAGE